MPAPERPSLRVLVTPDGMAASLRAEPGCDPLLLEETALCGLLAAEGVQINAAVRAALRAFIQSAAAAPGAVTEAVVAAGQPPLHGVDGHLEWSPGLDPTQPPSEAPPPGAPQAAVNHYERSAFTIVAAGTLVARIHPGVPGRDGLDVRGRTLACRSCKDADLKLDSNLRREPDGAVVAVAPGVLEYRHPVVRVRQELVIPKDVDFSTGNVHFPGTVRVEGGVRDCFRIDADRSVHIRGLVEGAAIAAGLDARLEGGVAGKERGAIRVGRDCWTRYLSNVAAAVGRDLHVEKEVINAQLTVGRAFKGALCVLSGGSLTAAGGVLLGVLGNESGTATEVRLGAIVELDSLRDRADAIIPEIEGRAAEARQRLEQLRAASGKNKKSSAEELTELEFEMATSLGMLGPIRQRLQRIESVVQKHTTIELVVTRRIHPGVRILAAGYIVEFHTDLRGPLRLAFKDGEPHLEENEQTPLDLAKVAKVVRTHAAAAAAARSAAQPADPARPHPGTPAPPLRSAA